MLGGNWVVFFLDFLVGDVLRYLGKGMWILLWFCKEEGIEV